jgi:hypothetical protein
MSMNVQSRAHRILKQLSAYEDWTDATPDVAFRLHDEENLIGVYHNSSKKSEENILITDRRLIFRDVHLSFDEITSCDIPGTGSQEKQNADRVTVTLGKGRTVDLPITGGTERFRDAFSFLRFLDRVVADRKQQFQHAATS